MEPILCVEGLTKVYYTKGKKPYAAVDRVDFRLLKGETLGLVGESGCGKTTLARLITRLIEPSAGTIRLNGTDITGARGPVLRQAYRQMQMVFQSPAGSFDPRKTVGHGIEESLRNAGMERAARRLRVRTLLEQCGLAPELAGRYPHELSGGQCQRAAIARALAIRPGLLICDEATSALDVTVQQQIMELLETLKRENALSILFICHDLALVQSFCDRVLVMREGRIVEEGPTERVICQPVHEYTRMLVEDAYCGEEAR